MAQRVPLRDAAQQHDGLGDHQLGHAAGVGVGRVEHRDAQPLGLGQVDLVGADAEAAGGDQLAGMAQHLAGELGARAQAHDVGVGDAFQQGRLGQRLLVVFDIRVAGALEHFHRGATHALQQQHLDVLPGKRGLHGGSVVERSCYYARIAALQHIMFGRPNDAMDISPLETT